MLQLVLLVVLRVVMCIGVVGSRLRAIESMLVIVRHSSGNDRNFLLDFAQYKRT